MIDAVFKTGKNYYPLVYLEAFKHVIKEKEISEYINGDIEISFDDSDREVSDEENSNEEISDEENSNGEN